MATQIYLAGVMWRFSEQFELPTPARDRGFVCLMSMLVTDGMSFKKAQQRIAELSKISGTAEGKDKPVLTAGYNARESDGSLAAVLEQFRNVPEAAGAPFRVVNLSKPIAAVVAIAGTLLALLLGKDLITAIGVGLVLGASVLAIALAVYRQGIRAKKSL